MPHAVEEANVPSEDETIARLLGNDPSVLEGLNDRDLDQEEKAADAQDFEDIDISDEEETTHGGPANGTTNEPAGGLDHTANDIFEDDGLDDLFGDKDQVSPPHSPGLNGQPSKEDRDTLASGHERAASIGSVADVDDLFAAEPGRAATEEESDEDAEVREQRELFAQAHREREERMKRTENTVDMVPAPPPDSELFSIIWPQFEANKPPRFTHLFPGKRAQYIGKTPSKPPKPVHPTKVNLDVEADQEKDFRLPGPASNSFLQRQAQAKSKGVVLTQEFEAEKDLSEEDDAVSLASEDLDDVSGYKWQDLVAVCQDWDIPGSPISEEDVMDHDEDVDMGSEFDGLFGDQDQIGVANGPRGSKRKRDTGLQVVYNIASTFEEPEQETAQLSKKVRIDMNDPNILVEPVANRERTLNLNDIATEREKKGGRTQRLLRRYNISNDEAYDMLKENRQSKIRGTLGSMATEHSMPAARLQYPFYKIRLSAREARSFHRPVLAPEPGLVHFEKLRHVKRKHLKGLGPQAIFAKSEDLTQGDNSNVLLLEYSEEYPVMMSSFGMGNRLVNYYRRKDENDTNRPKLDVGETEVLLSQDKSPFSIFGDVDPGQTMPTVSNGMYRAPVFKHNASMQDFLLISNRTGINGRKWFLKNIENLHIVGQEFPSVEVPGTHSRKVTDASKKRLRMLSYRLFRRHKRLKNEMIMRHIPGSDVAQNRSKMREFMNYDKDRGWLPRETEVPDESTIRAYIKPEDVCLLDSMQVGDQQLQDAGYNKGAEDIDEDEDDKQGQSIDEMLAPWQTSKNFLNACQGKAMLQLHGEGDPTGRGEAFNFIRTSMKGGFKEIGESVEDRLSAQNQKELGGHSYNVAKQQKKYNDTIRRIWEAQRSSLSSNIEHDTDMDDAEEQDSFNRGRTPSSAFPGRAHGDDESASMLSRTSTGSQGGRVLRIVRRTPEKDGSVTETTDVVRDPKVIREYLKRRKQNEIQNKSIAELKYTGNSEHDEAAEQLIKVELDRLYRNRGRREAREKAKGVTSAGSPEGDAASPGAEASSSAKKKHIPGSTQRKCANCGQVGHIKTNKKSVDPDVCNVCRYMSQKVGDLERLCPLLNGTIKQDEGFGDSAFGSISASTPAADDTPAPMSAGFG